MKIYFILVILVLFACADKKRVSVQDTPVKQQSSIAPKDRLVVKESFQETDIPANEYLGDSLKLIRENFKRINSVTSWTRIETRELEESTEGGVAKFYYAGNKVEKIVARNYGETYQQLSEYYLLNNMLSFVLEKNYKYNRPMYYDSAAMKENNDTEAFDFDKSKISEDRSYFHNGNLIHQLNNEDDGARFTDKYLKEQEKRINADFAKLLILAKSK